MEADRGLVTGKQENVRLLTTGTNRMQSTNIVLALPDADLAVLLKDVLWRETSCDIFRVTTGEQALRLVPQVRPNLLMVSSKLMDMTSREVFEYFQANKERISLRAILLYTPHPGARTGPSLSFCLDLSFGAEYLLQAIAALVGEETVMASLLWNEPQTFQAGQ
jgi:hypothetical protein